MIVLLAPAFALDANAQSNTSGTQSSIDDVARMIRQKKVWQILEARPSQEGSVIFYRFKLISNTGKVKIISIDPKRPNLRRLEQ